MADDTRRMLPWKTLVTVDEPLLPTFHAWLRHATNPVELLPPNPDPVAREAAIESVQSSRKTLLGTLAWDTGGLLVDHGFIKILGGGHPRIGSSFATWNKHEGIIFVAYDVIGGMFAIDTGALGTRKPFSVAYFAPDKLVWQDLGADFGQWALWAINGSTDEFYGNLRWETWKRDVTLLQPTQGWRFEPPLSEPPPEDRPRQKFISPIVAILAYQLSHAFKARLPR